MFLIKNTFSNIIGLLALARLNAKEDYISKQEVAGLLLANDTDIKPLH
jgi:hypothetical protein